MHRRRIWKTHLRMTAIRSDGWKEVLVCARGRSRPDDREGATCFAIEARLTGRTDGTSLCSHATPTDRLEARFLYRCLTIDFSSYGMAGEIAEYLDRVWHAEGGNGNGPDFARLAKDCRNNVRDCLGRLGVELMTL